MADQQITRARIVAGARAQFFSQGFRRITMDDLARELRMSKKTLYEHFPSKTELVQACVETKLGEVEAELNALRDAGAPSFGASLESLLALFHRHTDELKPPFIRDVRTNEPQVFEYAQQRRAELVREHFGRILREGRRAGKVRKDIPVNLMVEVLLSAANAVVTPARLEEFGLTARAGFTHIIGIFLRGVLIDVEEETS